MGIVEMFDTSVSTMEKVYSEDTPCALHRDKSHLQSFVHAHTTLDPIITSY
jgi:hypothetical protein